MAVETISLGTKRGMSPKCATPPSMALQTAMNNVRNG